MSFNDIKKHNGESYKGATIGHEHNWDYNNAVWNETKLSPDLWKIRFSAIKERKKSAPVDSGAKLNTQYHWYIAADQKVTKVDTNAYETLMEGLKLKVGHKRPYWREYSYKYPGQQTESERKIMFLKEQIAKLERGEGT